MADDKVVRIDYQIRSDTRGAKEASAATAGLRKETEKLGGQSKQTSHEVHSLDAEIRQLEEHIVSLNRHYVETGDRSVFREIGRDRSTVRNLELMRRSFLDVEHAAGEATNEVESFGEAAGNLRQGIFNAKGVLIGGAVGLGALLAPAIGAAISGAVAGTGIGAVMAAGILSSIKSAQVKSAAKDFLASVEADFFKGGDVFVGPVIRSLDILAKDVHSLNLGEVFAKAAPYVEVVAHGIGDLVKNFLPGLSKALDQAGPFSTVFAKGLADTGSALGSFMADVAASPGALEGLAFLFRVIDGTVVTLGQGLRELSDAFEYMVTQSLHATEDMHAMLAALAALHVPGAEEADKILSGVIRNLKGIKDAGDQWGVSWRSNVPDIIHLNTEAEWSTVRYRTALQEQNQTMEESLRIFDELHGSILNANQAMADLYDSLKRNGKTVDENTQAGRDNVRAFDAAFKSWQSWRQGQIDAGKDADKATREYDKQVQKLLELEKQAGATQQQLDDLAKAYLIQIVVSASNVRGNIATIGSASGVFDTGDLAHQHLAHRASGGPGVAGQGYIVHDSNRPEIFMPGTSGYFTPWQGGGVTQIQVGFADSGGGGSLQEALNTWVRKNLQFTVVGSKVQVSVVR